MPTSADKRWLPFRIVGVDEVGRGPLAGPVVAAAVVLDPHRPVDGLDDSKRLDEAERERLDRLIRGRALAWCVASASVAEIDELDILQASLLAMQRAVTGLVAPPPGAPAADRRADARAEPLADPCEARRASRAFTPALVLVDGNRCPALPYPACAVVGGDGRVKAIAAASIVAKVARDGLMKRWHERHPEFGFAAHKGYATKAHRDALARHGVLALHRRSFAPVRDAVGRAAHVPATECQSRTDP